MVLALALGAHALPAHAAPVSSPEQEKTEIACVATLAILASDQERGGTAARNLPRLSTRGGMFAQHVGDRLVAKGQTREAVRDAILAAVATQQNAAKQGGAMRDLPDAQVQACVAMLDREIPVPPPPSLPRCAALSAIAYGSIPVADHKTTAARDLQTIASVLDHRAREALRASGKSGPQTDAEMDAARELAEVDVTRANDERSELEFEACLEMARP